MSHQNVHHPMLQLWLQYVGETGLAVKEHINSSVLTSDRGKQKDQPCSATPLPTSEDMTVMILEQEFGRQTVGFVDYMGATGLQTSKHSIRPVLTVTLPPSL